MFVFGYRQKHLENVCKRKSVVLHMTWEGGWDYSEALLVRAVWGLDHIHDTILIYTPPHIQNPPKPGPAKITLQTALYI